MKGPFKYDVAISVAEEDRAVADQIAEELKKQRIRYYYYVEKSAESWGRHIIDLTMDTFGRRARFVLMITSDTFLNKYWSGIEKLIALAKTKMGQPHILQLRLDDTVIDGISRHVVYQDWKNNPEEITRMLKEKIRVQKWIEWCKIGIITVCIGCSISVLLGLYILLTPTIIKKIFPLKHMQQVLITGAGIDSFYISNTEVTIAEYKKYCDSTGKPFPPQQPNVEGGAPVSNITWYEAVDFCKSRNGRLPTEKEWEYAAGAGLHTKYSGGNAAQKVAVNGPKKQAVVGSKNANAFNIYDMTGNVAEWCADWSDTSQQCKIVKGGSYESHISPINELELKYTTKADPNERHPTIGFRIAWNKQ